MERSLVAAGSLGALAGFFAGGLGSVLVRGADVVVLPTAAAFLGAAQAAVDVARSLEGLDVQLEALMVVDRASAEETHFEKRIDEAALVVLCDGAGLHARSVWRDTRVGAALGRARRIGAVGSSASVLGEVMIDPRGGAPTTGLGLTTGVAFCAPASEDQLARTRKLLDEQNALVVLGARGVLVYENAVWRVVVDLDLIVSRGDELTSL
ncbi:MAG TPA: hypothetical protein VGE75_08530 [Acidimicrobiales bacterium]